MNAKIIGTGSFVPDNIVSNDDLSKVVETNNEWIYTRTGIQERRISKGDTVSQMAAQAALKAIENSKIKATEIDLILVATMSADSDMPNTACEIQKEIGAVNAICFDLSAACSGFVFALNTAQAYIKSGMAEMVLIVGAEMISKLLDWTDRSTCVLFGDGAGAVIVKAAEEGFIGAVNGSDGTKKEVLTCKGKKIQNLFIKEEQVCKYIQMNGQEVFKFAVKTIPDSIEQLLEKTNVKKEEIKYFVLHQANERILQSVSKRLKIKMDKFPINLQKYGNTSAASIPILLDELNKENQLHVGDKIILSGFGGGLTWGTVLLSW